MIDLKNENTILYMDIYEQYHTHSHAKWLWRSFCVKRLFYQ